MEPLPDLPTVRADRAAKRDQLVALVRQMIADAPHRADGHVWAGPLKAADWAQLAGLTKRTFDRLIAAPPFVVDVRGAGAAKATAVRIASPTELLAPPPPTDQKIANTMAKLWRTQTERAVSRREYGCLCGLARELPAGRQVDIFRYTIRDWSGFMAMVTLATERIAAARAAGEDIWSGEVLCDHTLDVARALDGVEVVRPRLLCFPSLALMRRFAVVMIDNWELRPDVLNCAPDAQDLPA